MGPRAVFLDVGGVFHLPDDEMVREALLAAGAEADLSRFERAHYVGVAAVDTLPAEASDAAIWDAFCRGFAEGAGVPRELRAAAERELGGAFRRPGMWSRRRRDSVESLPVLAEAALAVAIVSNSDGTLEERLRDQGICQEGDGPGTPVDAVVDSGAVGVEKPDPRIFRIALERTAVEPAEVIHVGDSVRADVLGAVGAGLGAVHFDPLGLCTDTSHDHARGLDEVLRTFVT